jgi:hypothetical protein
MPNQDADLLMSFIEIVVRQAVGPMEISCETVCFGSSLTANKSWAIVTVGHTTKHAEHSGCVSYLC